MAGPIHSGGWHAQASFAGRGGDSPDDGYSCRRFFFRILVPANTAGIGVAAFFCLMFSWAELLLAKTLPSSRPPEPGL